MPIMLPELTNTSIVKHETNQHIETKKENTHKHKVASFILFI